MKLKGLIGALKAGLRISLYRLRGDPPLVTVIITSYNHGHFLAKAIDSVLNQEWGPRSTLENYKNPVEIVVVDDGSTDHTRQVAESYPGLRYVYQKNRGLSAARNRGIRASRGRLLLFLDADDWLYPNALGIGVYLMDHHPDVAFVSGGHDKVDSEGNILSTVSRNVEGDHYQRFLEGNYIGMHAAVLYRKKVFRTVRFDPKLKAGEDYDVYLRITRQHPVLHHSDRVAAYRMHQSNMSADREMMLRTVLAVLSAQEPFLKSEAERAAFRQGQTAWTDYYRGR
ncbi:glycosyltransferase [Larkinella soli]|uniref:glycosyltransferase n=1 Tax=Larkinella soli TaxID=1770527 RepID=UPI000FFB0C24|nr:glycosyltransferase [Larkinella soli]